MNKLTGFLYARPSFLEGVACLMDFGNTFQTYNSSLSPEQADFLALSCDWIVIGDDLRAAIDNYAIDNYKDMRLQATEDLLRQTHESIASAIEE